MHGHVVVGAITHTHGAGLGVRVFGQRLRALNDKGKEKENYPINSAVLWYLMIHVF